MKTAFYIGLIFLSVISASAQHYDLLVKTDGDSIACKIDSITASNYFFEMKNNGYWVHTNIDKKDVIKYEAGVVDKKTTQFIHGTSIIESQVAENYSNNPRTAIFIELGGKGYGSINVDFRIKRNHRLSLGLAINDYDVVDKSGVESDTKQLPSLGFMYYYVKGKNKSFFELGIGMSTSIRLDLEYASIDPYQEKHKNSPLIYYGVIGYRYQKSEGLLFRAGFTPLVNPNSYFLPVIGLSIGYSF